MGGAEGIAIAQVYAFGNFLNYINHLELLTQLFRVLIEAANRHGFTPLHRAAIGFLAAAQQIQQGGFTHAVGANNAHPILGGKAVAEVFN